MMSYRKKVLVAITARPSYSRIRSALVHLRDDHDVDLKVLCSGSALLDRYGRVVDFIREDGFDVVDEMYTFVEGDDLINMALTTSNTITYTATILRRERSDVAMTIADRYETMGTAVAASYMNVPLVHVQGGELTGNIDEKVRHAITKLADLHLVSTDSAGHRLARMGEDPASIHVTGCPSIDIARESLDISVADVSREIDRIAAGTHLDINGDYLVVLLHPETDTYEHSFERMAMLLEEVSKLDMPAILFWPNVDAGSDHTSKAIRVFRESGRASKFTFVKNLEGHLFLALLRHSRCLVGNSSVGIRECSYLGTPVINIGHRQQGRERAANVLDIEWEPAALAEALRRQIAHGPYTSSTLYGDGHAGKAIADTVVNTTPTFAKRFHDA
jgi:UDP-hydrolysing UDP-N-acetyl-D-glucosamine 2-epimerase